MIELKEVKHYPDTNSVEATWVDRIQLPDVQVPATDAVIDEEGNVITPAVEAHTVPGGIEETVVKCHSYADVQMDMFRADIAEFGSDIAEYEALIALVDAGIKPPVPDSPTVRWEKIKAKRDDITRNGGCLVDGKLFHTDTDSKQQQMALTMLGASIPANLMWKTMDGSFIAMTQTLAMQLFAAQVQREQIIFAHAEAINADPLADIDAGWPDRYEVAPV